MEPYRIIGIDIGTTYCYMSQFSILSKETKVILDEFAMPSVVAFTNDKPLIGKEAKKYNKYIKNVLYDTKRLIGREYEDFSNFPKYQFDVENDNGEIVYKYTSYNNNNIVNKTCTPTAVLEEILKNINEIAMREIIVKDNKLPTYAVITVPTFFNCRQRKCVLTAAGKAGLKVSGLINGPTAAAIHYAIKYPSQKYRSLAIIDLGGGSIDISIFEEKNLEFEILATLNDPFIGGRNIDEILLNYLLNKIKKENRIDLSNDLNARQNLLNCCEKAKIELSSYNETTINIENSKLKKEIIIKRQEFLDIVEISALFNRVTKCLMNIKKYRLSDILLVGGTSNIPYFKETLFDQFQDIRIIVETNSAAAKGASEYAAILLDVETNFPCPNGFSLIERLSSSIGMESSKKKLQIIFDKGSIIPTKKIFLHREEFYNFYIRFYEGEVTGNRFLGEVRFGGNTKPNEKTSFFLIFAIDSNGLLTVTGGNRLGQNVLELNKKSEYVDALHLTNYSFLVEMDELNKEIADYYAKEDHFIESKIYRLKLLLAQLSEEKEKFKEKKYSCSLEDLKNLFYEFKKSHESNGLIKALLEK